MAAPYRHFADKESLLVAVIADGLAELGTTLAALDAADPLTHLHAIGHHYLEFVSAEPALYQLMLGGSALDVDAYPELATVRSDVEDVFVRAVEEALRQGVIEGSADAIIVTMRCVTLGLAVLAVAGEIPADRARSAIDRVFATVDHGLLPRTS